MSETKRIHAPLSDKDIASLKAGDEVLLSGTIYTARDQAHLRLCGMIDKKEELPVDLTGQVIYYCGPTPSRDGIIGSCGPTTAGRMDSFTPALLKAGMKGMIGKGRRSPGLRKEIGRQGGIYFVAPGGAGAYLKEKVRSCEVAAFEDLGPEAIYRLTVEDFPLVVGIDSQGKDIYEGM